MYNAVRWKELPFWMIKHSCHHENFPENNKIKNRYTSESKLNSGVRETKKEKSRSNNWRLLHRIKQRSQFFRVNEFGVLSGIGIGPKSVIFDNDCDCNVIFIKPSSPIRLIQEMPFGSVIRRFELITTRNSRKIQPSRHRIFPRVILIWSG